LTDGALKAHATFPAAPAHARCIPAESVLDVEISRMDDIDLVVLRGRLDASSASLATAKLSTLINKPSPRVLVSLADLHSISSAGLRVVLVLAKQVNGVGGRLALCELSATVQLVFEISGLIELLPVFIHRGDAAAHLSA
jgi:stage II sporulation protein AA (anti-sigma F factor antagonist)